ncbi:hypothetical protein ACQEVZ_14635 [Dactylosporangium sp. CA-152071]|uniref:hypothetical protein n=1 Tax=Dactylosporangium sp. CA-152071 TaxID=3239933 RepID=UPI003D8CF623
MLADPPAARATSEARELASVALVSICRLIAVSSSAAADSVAELSPRLLTASRVLAVAAFNARAMSPTSSRCGMSASAVRSPAATAVSTAWTRRIGRTMSPVR